MDDIELKEILTSISESTRRTEDKLARLEVAHIELLAKIEKLVRPK